MKKNRNHFAGWVRAIVSGPRFISAASLAVAFAMLPTAVSSQEPYFAGQTIELLTSYSDGSRGNTIMREWGQAFERLNPDSHVIVRNNSGGTSALAAALLADAEPDGLTIGTSDIDSIVSRAIGEDIQDISKFAIIGSLSRKQDTLFASIDSGIRSIDDLKERTAIIPVRSTLSNDYIVSLLVNTYLGTRIRPVTGYSSAEAELAYQSGEGQLVILTEAETLQAIKDGTGVPLVALTPGRLDGDGKLPGLKDLSKNNDTIWLADLIEGLSYSRILVAPAKIPADRLEALRGTFVDVTKDSEFVSLVSPLTSFQPTPGDKMEKVIRSIGSDADDLKEKLTKALECGKELAESGEACEW